MSKKDGKVKHHGASRDTDLVAISPREDSPDLTAAISAEEIGRAHV